MATTNIAFNSSQYQAATWLKNLSNPPAGTLGVHIFCRICDAEITIGEHTLKTLWETHLLCQSHYAEFMQMKKNPNALIDSIQGCKDDCKLTWSDLSAKCDIKDMGATISHWRGSGYKVNLNQLDQIAIAFNKTPGFFFKQLPTQTTQNVAKCILNCLVCHAEGKKYQGVTLCQVHILYYQNKCKIPEFFGQKIVNRLKERRMTQAAASRLLGVCESVFYKKTTGRVALTLEQLAVIAVVLEVPLKYFLTDDLVKSSNTDQYQVSQMQDKTQPLVAAENTSVEPEAGLCYTSNAFDRCVFNGEQSDLGDNTFNLALSAPEDADSKKEAVENAMSVEPEWLFDSRPSDGWEDLPMLFPDDDAI